MSLYLSGVFMKLNSLSRKHAKVSEEEATGAQAANISDTEIEAAKKEWADLVLSDDEWFRAIIFRFIPPPLIVKYGDEKKISNYYIYIACLYR